MPRSNGNPRIWLMRAVRRCTTPRTRCQKGMQVKKARASVLEPHAAQAVYPITWLSFRKIEAMRLKRILLIRCKFVA